jgi:hypothetical protein
MDPTVIGARNEALSRIGRNVVLFQELEGILKFLAVGQHPSAPLSKAKALRVARAESVSTQTLGQIAGQVADALYADSDAESSSPTGISEPWLTFSFRIVADADSVNTDRKAIKALIDERNDLVHHLLSRWNLHDPESCRALCVELDGQRSRIVREIERYRAYANSLQEMAKELQAYLDSDEGRRQFNLAFLQQSRLVAVLTAVATECARLDGWTLLSTAGARLRQLIPEEFNAMKAEHGEGSLQRLVLATELFDVTSEQTVNGTRSLYRPRMNS